MLPVVNATRFVAPLREGGSLPGLVEADDLGTYVTKWHRAAQGPKALVAEVIVGELARRLGLPMPDLVRLEFDAVIGRSEVDQEVQELIVKSAGLNLGMDFLPGSVDFNPVTVCPDGGLAARILWLDAFTSNIDRSWRNANLLVWHGDLWLIDHGAALWFHHSWKTADKAVDRVFDAADHVLLASGGPRLAEADAALAPLVTEELLREVTALVPDAWLEPSEADAALGLDSPQALRDAYVKHLFARVSGERTWLPDVANTVPKTTSGPGNRPDWMIQLPEKKWQP